MTDKKTTPSKTTEFIAPTKKAAADPQASPEQEAPRLTDEPGKITKLTGRSSISSPGTRKPAGEFVTDKQKKLGEVDWAAKGKDPARFAPKRTLADGTRPKTGMHVVHRSGAQGQIKVTYQIACAVTLADGRIKTMAYSTLNRRADRQ